MFTEPIQPVVPQVVAPSGPPPTFKIIKAPRHRVKEVRPFKLRKGVAERVDADFKHTLPTFNLQPDEPLEGDERLLLDPNKDVQDDGMVLVTDENGTRKVKMTPEQREEFVRQQVFRKAFSEQQLTFDDMLPQRIKICYRVIREMGRIRGMVQDNESLDYALKSRPHNVDPWVIPEKYNRPKDRRALSLNVVELMLASEELPQEWRVQRWDFEDGKDKTYVGVGLMPPQVGRQFLMMDGTILDQYDPYEDQTLLFYLNIFDKTQQLLSIEAGSKLEPELGRYGLQGIMDPYFVRAVFPTKIQILTWEHLLIDQVVDLLVDGSNRYTRKKLFDQYGFLDREIDSLVRLAQARAMQQNYGDKDVNRAIVLMKIEDYIRRSRDALNLKAELDGLKQLALVMGLTSEQEDAIMTDFVELMKKVNQERTAERRPVFVENTAGKELTDARVNQAS